MVLVLSSWDRRRMGSVIPFITLCPWAMYAESPIRTR
jgi:hypothetical protein